MKREVDDSGIVKCIPIVDRPEGRLQHQEYIYNLVL